MKVWNYVIISLGLALLFELAGIPVATDLLTKVGISTSGLSIKSASIYLAIFGVGGILIGLGTGIIIGTLTRSSPENYIILPFIVSSGTLFFATFFGITSYALANFEGWIGYLILFIMALLCGGYIIALYEHFRGTD